jgi:hypothetical protein
MSRSLLPEGRERTGPKVWVRFCSKCLYLRKYYSRMVAGTFSIGAMTRLSRARRRSKAGKRITHVDFSEMLTALQKRISRCARTAVA